MPLSWGRGQSSSKDWSIDGGQGDYGTKAQPPGLSRDHLKDQPSSELPMGLAEISDATVLQFNPCL